MRKLAPCVVLVLVALGSCTEPVCGCTPRAASAVVLGRVTTLSGAPVANATVLGHLNIGAGACTIGAQFAQFEADAQGRYRGTFLAWLPIDSACVFVTARPPSNGPSLRDTIVGPFRLSFRYDAPLDSLVLDLVLSP